MIYGFRVWGQTSCQDNGSPAFNDFYFDLEGGMGEQRAASIAARCSEFVAQQCAQQTAFYGVNSFPAPMGSWFAAPDTGCYWFPATRMYATGTREYNLPEGALHLCLRKWAVKAPGHFMLWGALDQTHVGTNGDGKLYLTSAYNRARLADTWGLISSMATGPEGATPVVATHGPGYTSISLARAIGHISASGVSDLRAIERAGYFDGYKALAGVIPNVFYTLESAWQQQYILRDWKGLKRTPNPFQPS